MFLEMRFELKHVYQERENTKYLSTKRKDMASLTFKCISQITIEACGSANGAVKCVSNNHLK